MIFFQRFINERCRNVEIAWLVNYDFCQNAEKFQDYWQNIAGSLQRLFQPDICCDFFTGEMVLFNAKLILIMPGHDWIDEKP